MNFICNALYSLDEMRSGFLIPAFSKPDSNDTFFQDLSIDGRVERFLKVDTSKLFLVPVLPPALGVSIGDFGLLAFLDDEDGLEIGIPLALAESIDPSLVTDPVVRMELASLRADGTMQRQALRNCRDKFIDERLFESWTRRERRLFRRVFKESASEKPDSDEFQSKLIKEFQEIEGNLNDKGWTQKWLRLWGQGYEKRQLVGIAYLRQDSGILFDKDGPEIFRIILEHEWTEEIHKRCIDVLGSTSLDASGWYTLYFRLMHRKRPYVDDLNQVAFDALHRWLEEKDKKSQSQWISLWSSLLFESQVREEEIRHLGVMFIKQSNNINLNVARSMFLPLSYNEKSFVLIEDEIVNWIVGNVRSDTVWATLFIRVYKFSDSKKLIEIGVEWLEYLGGNLSQWIDIWHLLEDRISKELYIKLGIGWLGRARRDMRSWIDVFFELFDKFDLKRDGNLRNIGIDWVNSYQGNIPSRRKMNQTLEYMKALMGE